MARHFIKDGKGSFIMTTKGERLFWSDSDGDSDPDNSQTVYREHKGFFGGSSKVDGKYDRKKNIFRK